MNQEQSEAAVTRTIRSCRHCAAYDPLGPDWCQAAQAFTGNHGGRIPEWCPLRNDPVQTSADTAEQPCALCGQHPREICRTCADTLREEALQRIAELGAALNHLALCGDAVYARLRCGKPLDGELTKLWRDAREQARALAKKEADDGNTPES